MAVTAEISTTARPVFRVKVTRSGLRPIFRYFTTPGAAAKFAAWEIVAGQHKVYEASYTVDGRACECHEPESGPGYYSAGWEDCPLHDHRDGYYARLAREIKARLLASLDAGTPAPTDPQPTGTPVAQALAHLQAALAICDMIEDINAQEAARLTRHAITQANWVLRKESAT